MNENHSNKSEFGGPANSEKLDLSSYFNKIEEEIKKAYETAEKAREKGKDPENYVDIPLTKDLAEKSVGLVATVLFPELKNRGIEDRIRELEKRYGKNDERIAFIIGKEIAKGKFYEFKSLERAVDAGIRIGLSYLTQGVVTAPLEGIHSIKIRKNDDGTNYLAIYYSGPIRSAGGTASVMSVLLSDYVRKEVGIDRYKPREVEIERYAVEVEDYYTRVTKKQYTPTREEVKMIARNVPVEITGTPTEKIEVSNFKDLERIETNIIRGGMCLVYLDGLPLKASKINKKIKLWGKELGLEHWSWLENYLKFQEELHGVKKGNTEKYKPNTLFLHDLVAGRPVFAYPATLGGFRLRYGRSRTGGDCAMNFHPATMEITNGFIAIGTQLRIEYPGKGAVTTPCDSLEPPVVKLKNGNVIRVESREQAKKISGKVQTILSLGDILVSYGEFLNRGQRLLPSAYVEEWWALEVKKALKEKGLSEKGLEPFINKPFKKPDPNQAIQISKELDVPLHPYYTYWWYYLSHEEFMRLYFSLRNMKNGSLENIPSVKNVLEKLLICHTVNENKIWLSEDDVIILKTLLDLENDHSLEFEQDESFLNKIKEISGIKLRNKAPTFIGARMGRPEKAERRLMKGRPQILFPCGRSEGGRMRNLISAYEHGTVTADIMLNYCPKCNRKVPFSYCPFCGGPTEELRVCVQCGKTTKEKMHCGKPTKRHAVETINLKELLDVAKENLGLRQLPELLKSPRAVMSKNMCVEPLEKGLLRQKYDLYVNKDGTIRYDSTNLIMTHFKPKEIKTSIKKLKELGYTHDIHGRPLENEEQILLLKPQDIVISDNEEFSGAEYLYRTSKFIDELLTKFYGLNPYYNLRSKEDIIGHLIIALAPHTCSGIIGRVIGFTPAKGTFALPYWHAAKRRDADGDEDSIMLLLDALLNFSRNFLPDHVGGRTMDAPLILASILDPEEVDDESWKVDSVESYPLELYEASLEYKNPWEVKIQVAEDMIRNNNPFNFKYTHETTDITDAPTKSAYVTLGEMSEKVKSQLGLARKIQATNAGAVAELLLKRHFLGDIKGNLRKFSRQQFRCVKCNEKYRRPPLSGKCTKCGGKLLLTVSEGTVKKYLDPSEEISNSFEVSNYMRQQISIMKYRIQSLFGKEDKQFSLGHFVSNDS